MIDDMEAIADELHDPAAGPQGGRIAERLRTAQDPARERLPLLHGQLRRTARGGARPDAIASPAQVCPFPASHRSAVDADYLSDDHRSQPLLQQRDGTQATAFQLRRTPLWAHPAPPQGEFRTLFIQRSITSTKATFLDRRWN